MATAQRLCRMLVAIWQRRGYRRGRRFELCGRELSTFGTHRCGLGGIGGADRRSPGDSCESRPTRAVIGPYLSPEYGFGPSTTTCRNRGAANLLQRKYLSVNWMRRNIWLFAVLDRK